MSGHVSDDERGPDRTGPAPLGEALRTARAEQGRSLADVSHAINLRETVVQAIEHDDFALCGGDVYARGHIRAYARLLGLDPAPLVRSYDERTGAPPEGARVALLADDDVPLERSGRPNWPLVVGAALLVVVALLGWQLVSELRGPGRPAEQVVGTATTTPTGSPTTPAAPTSGPSTGAGTTPPPATSTGTASGPTSGTATTRPDQVAVALKITGETWVEVRDAKGRTVYSGLLTKGDAKRFSDTAPLRLTLGNAGGVELTVNGTPLGTAGKAGEVKRLTFRPGEEAQLS
jgi:cytoskeletal protein RodZ